MRYVKGGCGGEGVVSLGFVLFWGAKWLTVDFTYPLHSTYLTYVWGAVARAGDKNK